MSRGQKRTRSESGDSNPGAEKKRKSTKTQDLENQVKTFIASEIGQAFEQTVWTVKFDKHETIANMSVYFYAAPFTYQDSVPFTQKQVDDTITDKGLMSGVTQIYDYQDAWKIMINNAIYDEKNEAFCIEIKAVKKEKGESLFPNNIILAVQHILTKIKKHVSDWYDKNNDKLQVLDIDFLDDPQTKELNLNHYRAIFQNDLFQSEMKQMVNELGTYDPGFKIFVHNLNATETNNVQSIQIVL